MYLDRQTFIQQYVLTSNAENANIQELIKEASYIWEQIDKL